MRKTTLKYKTIFLSDVHLGTPDCKIEEVNHFLNHVHCEKLVLNGDIVDGWSLARKGGWTDRHTRFVRLVLNKIEKRGTEVIYLRGNHDDVLKRFLPLLLGKLKFVNEHIHENPRGNYLVVHGDCFDGITKNLKWLAVLGDIGYQILLKINSTFNRYRAWRGKDPCSLSKTVKAKVKGAVSFLGHYEEKLQQLAHKNRCVGMICGHIHTPDDRMVGEIHYLNSGDWVESLSALVEYEDGKMEIIKYDEFCNRLEEKAQRKAERKPWFASKDGEPKLKVVPEDDPPAKSSQAQS